MHSPVYNEPIARFTIVPKLNPAWVLSLFSDLVKHNCRGGAVNAYYLHRNRCLKAANHARTVTFTHPIFWANVSKFGAAGRLATMESPMIHTPCLTLASGSTNRSLWLVSS